MKRLGEIIVRLAVSDMPVNNKNLKCTVTMASTLRHKFTTPMRLIYHQHTYHSKQRDNKG